MTALEGARSAPRVRRTLAARSAPRAIATVVLVACLSAAAALYLHETRSTTFAADEWVWILGRRGWSAATFLEPHNGHFSLIPICIYKVMWAIWGLRTYVPYRVLEVSLHLLCSTLVYVYARRRLGATLALVPAVLVAFLAAGAENVMWPFQIGWLLAATCGVGALLLLDRQSRRADVAAAVVVACGLASSGPGIAVALGIAVDVLAGRGRRERWWVAVAPLALFTVWFVLYETSTTTGAALARTPAFVVKTVAAALAGLFGQWDPGAPSTGLAIGGVLLLALALGSGVSLARGRASAGRVIALATIVVVFISAVAISRAQLGTYYDSRYLYMIGLFAALLAIELAAGIHVPRAITALALALAIGAALSGLGQTRALGRLMRASAVLVRADLAALRIGRPLVPPHYVAAFFPGSGFLHLDAARYFAAADALGTPADTLQQLARAPNAGRAVADQELIHIDELALVQASDHQRLVAAVRRSTTVGERTRAAGCQRFPDNPQHTGSTTVTLPSHGALVDAQRLDAIVAIRRFGDTFQPIGTAVAGRREILALRPDAAATPWRLSAATAGGLVICGLA